MVTGASGYIGSHIVANLLSKGMNVRATVRDKNDPERVDHLKSMEIADGGSIEIVEMDLFDEDSVDSAISGCTDLIHTAATVIVRSRDPQRKIVDPSVIGTKNVVSRHLLMRMSAMMYWCRTPQPKALSLATPARYRNNYLVAVFASIR